LKDTLINSYKEQIDYKIIKGKSNGLKGKPKDTILLTPKCFKLLFLRSKTKKIINFQEQYYKLEKIIFEYNNFIVNSLEEKIKILNKI
jgi:hypothetical protein